MKHNAISTHHMGKAEYHFDRQGKTGRVADEAAEGHGVDDAHHPGVLVAEYFELTLQVRLDIARDQLHQHDGGEQNTGNNRPLGPTGCTQAGRRR